MGWSWDLNPEWFASETDHYSVNNAASPHHIRCNPASCHSIFAF